jgi:glycine/D-amino acid oxidase-like deaminating enzyme
MGYANRVLHAGYAVEVRISRRMRSVPYFLDVFPRARRPDYPRARGHIKTSVVVVGGGLTGCACAAAFAAAGVKVVLLEADRIGAGATSASPGLLRQDLDVSFQETAALHGLRTARHVWQGFRRASLDFGTAIRRFAIRADLTPQDLLFLSRDAEGARRLKKEFEARRAAGVEGSWVNARAVSLEAGLSGSGAIRTKGDALDPYRACVGLAGVAADRGAVIHERTIVRRIRAARHAVNVSGDGVEIAADAVVVASGALPDDLRGLRRHFKPAISHAVVTEPLPAPVRRDIGKRSAALRDMAAPPHLLRWLKDDRVLFSGAEGPMIPPRARAAAVIPQANELMYELTTLYPSISGVQPGWGWDAVHYSSPDGIPVVGPHRNFPRHLFALGQGRHGAGVSWLAARVLLRSYLGEAIKGDELFGFARVL